MSIFLGQKSELLLFLITLTLDDLIVAADAFSVSDVKFVTRLVLVFYLNNGIILVCLRLYKPVSDWLEMLPLDSTGLNM